MKRDFLLEIGTEELPPGQLVRLRDALAAGIVSGFDAAQLDHGDVSTFATPRRLAVWIHDLAHAQPVQHIERRGPSREAAFGEDGKPTKAALGFARSCGVDDPSALEWLETSKGTWLVYRESRPGSTLAGLAPGIIEAAIKALPIERPMRWGSRRVEFVRPVHWVVMLHGNDVLPARLFDLPTGRTTRGHRFMSTGEHDIAQPADYESMLESLHVLASFERRRERIEEQVTAIAAAEGVRAVIDPVLLDEVTALVEWPVALRGRFDESFLSVPEEALVSAMKSHQRYFHMVDERGRLQPGFITVANLESNNPDTVIAGNERVITPRLSDATFFYRQDAKTTLNDRLDDLSRVVFHAKLGTYHDKAMRIASLAGFIASELGLSSAEVATAERAGRLCKSDLVTDMVGEFPELQGVMGRYYAAVDGEPAGVAEAIGEHYLPTHSGGPLPGSAAGQCVAVADKLDTLVGLFGIGAPPTGSRDPFALRRQTLGVIRIGIETGHALDLVRAIDKAAALHDKSFDTAPLIQYCFERLGTLYQEQGIGLDTYAAVRSATSSPTVLADLDRQVRAVHAFRQHERIENLVAANKRVANLLRQADPGMDRPVDPSRFTDDAEQVLYGALGDASRKLDTSVPFEERLTVLASLQPVIDEYFEKVLVMADDHQLKANRLATLSALRALFLSVADVSLLQVQGD
ncbi:MAG: glycine--tRNA ligase subunit beta [Pseudomonadales bacterium]|nr:glycine--tRNA ligase subunit beta [Pseudomonadales bacterium]